MQAEQQPDDGEELCDLCWNDHSAQFRVPDYRDGVTVCGTHANALEDGSWEHGETYEVVPLTDGEAEYVFVYGTLQDGSGYQAELTGWRKDDTGRYPTLVPNPDCSVTGEVHKVTPARLEQLDGYEGVGTGLYKRVEAPMGVWVYIGGPDRLGSRAALTFEDEYLGERMSESTLSLAADFDPREMPVESA